MTLLCKDTESGRRAGEAVMDQAESGAEADKTENAEELPPEEERVEQKENGAEEDETV